MPNDAMSCRRPLIIVHRGLAQRAPENTLASVRAALELPVDGIEIDVYLTVDGIPVVMHDPTVDRTTDGHGPVCAMTLAQLNELSVHLGWQERSFPPEPVPTLREVLGATRGRRLLCVEVKPKGIEREVLADIRQEDALEWVWLWTFFRPVVRRFHELEPRIPVAWLCAGFPSVTPQQFMEKAVEAGAAAVSVEIQDLTPEVVGLAHRHGLAIYSYDKELPRLLGAAARLGRRRHHHRRPAACPGRPRRLTMNTAGAKGLTSQPAPYRND